VGSFAIFIAGSRPLRASVPLYCRRVCDAVLALSGANFSSAIVGPRADARSATSPRRQQMARQLMGLEKNAGLPAEPTSTIALAYFIASTPAGQMSILWPVAAAAQPAARSCRRRRSNAAFDR
jgi:hypothetical protein